MLICGSGVRIITTRAHKVFGGVSGRAVELPSGAVVCVIVCVCRQQLACALIPIPKSSAFIPEGGGKESQLESIERGTTSTNSPSSCRSSLSVGRHNSDMTRERESESDGEQQQQRCSNCRPSVGCAPS